MNAYMWGAEPIKAYGMHIVLGLLGAIVTILVLLNRLAEAGIDLGGLNPFLSARRRRWRDRYEGNPLWQIDQPMEATAILMVAATKADGDMTLDQKKSLLNAFEREFHLSKKDAAGLLISSAHLLGDGSELRDNVDKFLVPSKGEFTDTQTSSALSLLEDVLGPVDSRHPNAQELLDKVREQFSKPRVRPDVWSPNK